MLPWITKRFVFFRIKAGQEISVEMSKERVSFFLRWMRFIMIHIFCPQPVLFFSFWVDFCGCGYLWFSLNLGRRKTFLFSLLNFNKFFDRDFIGIRCWPRLLLNDSSVWETKIYRHRTWPLERETANWRAYNLQSTSMTNGVLTLINEW